MALVYVLLVISAQDASSNVRMANTARTVNTIANAKMMRCVLTRTAGAFVSQVGKACGAIFLVLLVCTVKNVSSSANA